MSAKGTVEYRKKITSRRLAIHKEEVAIHMAAPLTRLGEISERTTQVTGARVMAYTEIPRRMNTRTLTPLKSK